MFIRGLYKGVLWICVMTERRKDLESCALKVGSFNTGVDIEDETDVSIVVASYVRSK